jgi:hypothetical protein
MKFSPLHGSWRRNACKIAVFVMVIGLALWPHRTLAACPRVCPQYLTRYCVREPDGTISTVQTNPCFACKRHVRILHIGACKL